MNPFGRKKQKLSQYTVKSKESLEASAASITQPPAKKLPDFFTTLSEKQINLLYSIGTIRRLEPGEWLFEEGKDNPFLSIVLEGVVATSTHGSPVVHSFGPGSFLSAMEFMENTPLQSSACAMEQAVVMTIEKNAMALMDEPTRELLYGEIIKRLTTRTEENERANHIHKSKIAALAKQLFVARTSHIYDYKESELILNIVGKIPKLPAYTHTLSSKLLDENASSNEIVSLIRQDPALVADVLKSINSSYYGLEQKISDINSAVMLLGFQSLYQIIMSEGIRKTMPDTPNFRHIHTHALSLSYIAFSLSVAIKVGVPVQLATIGLLHNMGESIVSLLVQRNPNLLVFIDSLDRPGLGAFLLEAWNFPKNISESVKYQNFPEFAAPTQIPENVLPHVAILYISQLCYQTLRGVREEDLPLVYFDDYKALLKLDDFNLQEITIKKVAADLKKKRESLPASLKDLIKS